jgi:hypothetical protein
LFETGGLVHLGLILAGAHVAQMDGKYDEEGDCETSRQCKVPAGEPRPMRCNRSRMGGGFFDNRRLGEVGDFAAVRADSEMSQHLLLLMRRQSMLNEGAELVCVGMLAGLEGLGHWLSGATWSVLSENAAD